MVPTSTPPSGSRRQPSAVLSALVPALSALVLSAAPAMGQRQDPGAFAHVPTDPTCDPSDLFDPAVDYPAGTGPKFVAVGDLDGDGVRDLAVANSLTLGVLINNGDGTFAGPIQYDAHNRPVAVAIDDLDGDGARDLAAINGRSGDVSVLINNGDGTFTEPAHYPMGVRSLPESLAIGDLDGDGAEDVASANVRRPNMLLNNGDGTFGDAIELDEANDPSSVAIGDLDGDHAHDLVVTDFMGGAVRVLRNNGDGTFAPAVAYAVGLATQSVVIGDLDGDGDRDLAAMNLATVDVSVLLNNGDGTFADPAHYPIGARSLPQSLAIGDLDGDGFRDLATVNRLRGNISVLNVLINNGDGTFADSIEYDSAHAHPASLAIGDLDNDDARDVVVANRQSDSVSVLLNRCAP